MSAQVKPYHEIQKQNIYDFSHTGGNKTSRAKDFIEYEISHKRPVIVIMQDYNTLEATYYRRFSPSVRSKSIVVKGKTQTGMCIHSERYSKLHKYVRPPNECDICSERHTCNYQAQNEKLTELIESSSDGFVILTTPRMLDGVLNRYKKFQPSIIIDDVPISQVITNEISATQDNLSKLIGECDAFLLENLSTIIKMLIEKKTPDEILFFIRKNKESINDELRKSQELINKMFTGKEKFAKYDSLFGLFDAVSCDSLVDIFYDEYGIFFDDEGKPGVLKIFSTKKNFEQYRILYLNASCNYIDEYYINQLDDLERIGVESNDNPQFKILQLKDAKYSLSTILDSDVIVKKVTTTCNHFNQITSDLGIKIPVFTHSLSYENKFKKDNNFQKINHTPISFRGSNTKGTNEFLNIPVSVIVGTPFLPASYFMHPAFKDVWRKESDILRDIAKRDRKKESGGFVESVYPVSDNITERCAVEELIQDIGRTLRVDPKNPEREKLVILFSKLKHQDLFEKECKKQNGANVFTYRYNRTEEQQKFFSTVNKLLPLVFRPALIEKIFNKLDHELAQGDCVKLGIFSHRMEKEFHKLASYKTIERAILDSYETEKQPIGKNGKPITIILNKKMSN